MGKETRSLLTPYATRAAEAMLKNSLAGIATIDGRPVIDLYQVFNIAVSSASKTEPDRGSYQRVREHIPQAIKAICFWGQGELATDLNATLTQLAKDATIIHIKALYPPSDDMTSYVTRCQGLLVEMTDSLAQVNKITQQVVEFIDQPLPEDKQQQMEQLVTGLSEKEAKLTSLKTQVVKPVTPKGRTPSLTTTLKRVISLAENLIPGVDVAEALDIIKAQTPPADSSDHEQNSAQARSGITIGQSNDGLATILALSSDANKRAAMAQALSNLVTAPNDQKIGLITQLMERAGTQETLQALQGLEQAKINQLIQALQSEAREQQAELESGEIIQASIRTIREQVQSAQIDAEQAQVKQLATALDLIQTELETRNDQAKAWASQQQATLQKQVETVATAAQEVQQMLIRFKAERDERIKSITNRSGVIVKSIGQLKTALAGFGITLGKVLPTIEEVEATEIA